MIWILLDWLSPNHSDSARSVAESRVSNLFWLNICSDNTNKVLFRHKFGLASSQTHIPSILVFLQRMGKPLELMATCHFHLLTMKTILLVAVKSARCVSKLHYPLFLEIFDTRAVLCSFVQFLLKVTSSFHLNQDIILPVLYPQS